VTGHARFVVQRPMSRGCATPAGAVCVQGVQEPTVFVRRLVATILMLFYPLHSCHCVALLLDVFHQGSRQERCAAAAARCETAAECCLSLPFSLPLLVHTYKHLMYFHPDMTLHWILGRHGNATAVCSGAYPCRCVGFVYGWCWIQEVVVAASVVLQGGAACPPASGHHTRCNAVYSLAMYGSLVLVGSRVS